MKHIFFSVHHKGVAGIVAALVANHIIGIAGQQIDHLAFAFISPLRPNNDYTGYGCFSIDTKTARACSMAGLKWNG